MLVRAVFLLPLRHYMRVVKTSKRDARNTIGEEGRKGVFLDGRNVA